MMFPLLILSSLIGCIACAPPEDDDQVIDTAYLDTGTTDTDDTTVTETGTDTQDTNNPNDTGDTNDTDVPVQ